MSHLALAVHLLAGFIDYSVHVHVHVATLSRSNGQNLIRGALDLFDFRCFPRGCETLRLYWHRTSLCRGKNKKINKNAPTWCATFILCPCNPIPILFIYLFISHIPSFFPKYWCLNVFWTPQISPVCLHCLEAQMRKRAGKLQPSIFLLHLVALTSKQR